MKVCRKLGLTLILCVCASLPSFAQQDFTFAQTANGFYWPLGVDDTQFVSKGGTWLNRDSTHNPVNPSFPYTTNLYHTGVDMFYNYTGPGSDGRGTAFGAPVYAISAGVVRAVSGPDTSTVQHGWGPSPSEGVLIEHTLSNGKSFLALYGHIWSGLKVNDVVTGGFKIGTVGHYYDFDDHLHFGIYPLSMYSGERPIPLSTAGSGPDTFGWGHIGNNYWPTGVSVSQINATATLPLCPEGVSPANNCSITDNFVDPVAFIKGSVQPYPGGTPPYTSPTFGPTCQNGSSQAYQPYGPVPPNSPAFHPDGTIVRPPAAKLTATNGLYGFMLMGDTKYLITSRQLLNTLYQNPGTGQFLGFDLRDIVTVSNEELQRYPKKVVLSGPIPWTHPSPNGRLLKDIGSQTVGIVTHYNGQDGVLVPFATWEAFAGLGYSSCNWAGAADFNDTSKYPRPSGIIVDNMTGDGDFFASETDPPASFSVSTSVSPISASVGQDVTVNLNLTDNGGGLDNTIVDIEIYNSTGTQVSQTFLDSQYFFSGQSVPYTADWVTTASGGYTVKVGVFDAGWSALEYWNDTAATFTVGGGGSVDSGVIDIWWPTNGASVSGTQPFKALLENTALANYSMYWQVDGGQLNLMGDNSNGGDHKEAEVDLSGWTWNGNGPYVVNFLAKDLSGNTVGQQSASITVTH